jgi:23S rRNA pseudouridine1911/1915/1917 synthase
MKDMIRLHHYVTKNINNLTESNYTPKEIQKYIELEGVLVDGTMVNKRLAKVWGNEKIDISHWTPREKASYEGIEMVWEDDSYMLFYKPFGLPVQEGAGHKDNNLVNWLIANIAGQQELKDLKTGDNNETTAGLVHRLDKDTQGLILIAKNYDALKHAQEQFRNRFVKKSYLTVLQGVITDEITIEGVQFRDPINLIKQIFVPKSRESSILKQYPIDESRIKDTKSQFTPLVTDGVNTLCKVRIFTGRMHQIRVTAQALGSPVVGDKIYHNMHAKLSDIDLSLLESKACIPRTIDHDEFEEIIHSVFKGHSFYLLSNELVFKDFNNDEQSFKIHEIE